jgi:hypothetical protein
MPNGQPHTARGGKPTNIEGFPKPGELIEITGAYGLEASDRAILNILYQHAHDSGNRVPDRGPAGPPLRRTPCQ